MSRSNSPLVKLDIFFKSLLNCEFISAKSFIFVLAQVWTHLLIYIFWLVYNNGFRIINSAFIFGIGKECVPMANMRAKRYGPRMTLDFDQKDNVRTILEFMQTLRKRKCLQPKEIEGIFSVGFLLIPLVAPYDQFLI